MAGEDKSVPDFDSKVWTVGSWRKVTLMDVAHVEQR